MNSNDIRYYFSGDDSSFQKAAKRVSSLFDTIKQKGQKVSDAFKKVDSSANSAGKSIKSAGDKSKKTKSNFDNLSKSLTKLSKLFRFLPTIYWGKLFADAIENSINFAETLNLFNVALGDATKQATKFINVMSERFGLDPAELMNVVGTFQNLTESIGFTSDQAYLLSENFTKLGTDLASLWNTSVTQAYEALQSAIVGLTKPIRQYGIDVTEAALRQTALSLGITDSVRTMTRASKVGLIYITVLQRAQSSMGDFANTIESPANQLRVLQQQFTILSRTIGDFFLGVISGVLPYLNGIIMALNAILRLFASLMGIKVGDFASAVGGVGGGVGDLAGGIEDAGDAAAGTAKKLNQLLAPFDELNILNADMDSGSGGGAAGGGIGGGGIDPRILEAMEAYNSQMEQVEMKATRIRDRLMEILGFTKHINEETGEITWTWNFDDMLKGLQSAWVDLINWWTSLSPGGKLAAIFTGGWVTFLFGKGLQLLLLPFSNMFKNILPIVSKGIGWLKTVNWSAAFAGVKPAVDGVVGSFTGMSTSTATIIGGVVALIAGIGIALWQLWTESEEFRTNITNSFTQIKDMIVLIFTSIWENAVRPFLSEIKSFVDQVIQLFMLLINTIGPPFNSLWNGFKDLVQGVVQSIINFLLGLLEFIGGIFSGDLATAIRGIVRMIASIIDAIANSMIAVLNVVIDALNWVINKVNALSITIPNNETLFGEYAGQTIGFNIPLIERLPVINLAGFARGGLLDADQIFQAGERGQYEAIGEYQGKSTVMPLENTSFVSAMREAVRRGIMDGLGSVSSESRDPIKVEVYIGGKKFDKVVYDAYTREKSSRGANILGGALYART